MSSPLQQTFQESFERLDPQQELYVAGLVDAILSGAQAAGASDVHLVPDWRGLQRDWRIDGVLQPAAHFADVAQIEQQAVDAGLETLFTQACHAVEQGHTSPTEVRRVFGARQTE